MRRLFSVLLLLALCAVSRGQNVTVSGALVGNGSYPTLTAAFAAINGGAQTGANITISLLNDTYEGTGTALLNSGGWASIVVLPVGQARTILGATTAGQALIDLNGADKVFFNGLLGGQRGLTVFNSSNASTAGTSTIRLRNGASFNRIRHCRILGASQTGLSVDGGNILFAGGGSGGNSDNSVRDSEIGPGSADLPSKLVDCYGPNVTANMNQRDTIADNDMVDCFGETTTSASLQLYSGAAAWIVDHNRFYQTATRTKLPSGGYHFDIHNSVMGDLGCVGNYFTNNTIGPRPAPLGGKTAYEFPNSNNTYTAVHMGNSDLFGSSSVINNTISDLQISYTGIGSGGFLFTGIGYTSSSGFITGNLIGSATDSNSIVIQGNLSGNIGFRGMVAGYGPGQQYSGNQLGGIKITNQGSGFAFFVGISGGHSLATISALNNTIGFRDAPIRVRAQGSGGSAYGINFYGGSLEINGNTVAYIDAHLPNTYSTTSFLTGSFSVGGIDAFNTGAMAGGIRWNKVHSLRNTHPSARTSVVGIEAHHFWTILGNQVHSLSLNTTAIDGVIIGINLLEGDPIVASNMVRLGLDADGQSITRGYQIIGMRNIYYYPQYDHNSVYIGGSGVSDTTNTYAVYSLAVTGNRRFINNIFYNARSNGSGTGKHYAILSGGSHQSFQTPPLSNGNDLYTPGVGGVVGRFNGADHLTLSDWSMATFQDYNSISHDPYFINPVGNDLTGDLHIGPVSPIEGIGVPVNSFPVDIDNQNRPALTPIDIGADAGNFTPMTVGQPEATILGNALIIADGHVSPNTLDGTDFGTTAICPGGTVYRTFQLRNTGTANLNLLGWSISGSTAFITFPPSVSFLQPWQTIVLTVAFTPTAPGIHTATLTLQSNDQDEGTYTFTVTGTAVADTIAPQAVCQSQNVVLGANGIGNVNATTLGTGSTDNCGIASYAASPSQFNCAQLGSRSVQLTVTDVSGITATCTATVNVIDNQVPQVSCQSTTLLLDTNGQANLSPLALHVSSSDNCGVVSYTASLTQFTCAQAGSYPVQLIVADAAGNTATCSTMVQVVETEYPQANCQPITVAVATNGTATVNAAALGAGSTDNCGITSYTASPAQFACSQLGTQAVQLTVADASGNTATCSTTVNVVDTQGPQASCQSITLVLDANGQASLAPVAIATGSTDNCGIASYAASPTQFTCAQLGSQPVQLTVTDVNGNASTCTSTVNVIDTQAPQASCQAATLVLDANGQASLNPASLDAGSTDNCSIASRVPSQVLFNCSDVGVQAITLTVTDAFGNTATCTAQVTILDTLAPVAVCSNLSITVPSSGVATITPAQVGSAMDLCGIASYQLSQTQFGCAQLGATTVLLTATDTHGNSSNCTATVTVTSAPLALQVNPPALGPCGHHLACAGVADGSASASPGGGCAPYTYAWSNGQSGATATGLGAGTHSVTVTSADGQQQAQSVTLTAPAPLFASATSTPSCPGSSTGGVTATGGGGQSCQAYSFLWSNGQSAASISNLASGTYTVTVTDAGGCTDTASTTVANLPSSTVTITQNQGTLMATSGFTSYQWYGGGGLIPGATAAQYTPVASGNYFVVVTDANGCSLVSGIFPFIFVGTQAAWPGWVDIVLYPNPGQGVFRFDLKQALAGTVQVQVTDLHGRVLYAEQVLNLDESRVFDVSELAAGVYMVSLMGAEGQRVHFRLLRE